ARVEDGARAGLATLDLELALCKLVAVVLFRACGRRGDGFGHGMGLSLLRTGCFSDDHRRHATLDWLRGAFAAINRAGRTGRAGRRHADLSVCFNPALCALFRFPRLRTVKSLIGVPGQHRPGYLSPEYFDEHSRPLDL